MDFQKQIAELMAQLPAIQQRMEDARARAEQIRAEGSAGGGLVTAKVNGKHRVESLTIDANALMGATALAPEDIALLEDLIVAAVNQAQERVTARLKDELTEAAGGLPLPDLSSILGGGSDR